MSWLKAVLATLVNCVMHRRVQEGLKKARWLDHSEEQRRFEEDRC
jgi:hypothetical protein